MEGSESIQCDSMVEVGREEILTAGWRVRRYDCDDVVEEGKASIVTVGWRGVKILISIVWWKKEKVLTAGCIDYDTVVEEEKLLSMTAGWSGLKY